MALHENLTRGSHQGSSKNGLFPIRSDPLESTGTLNAEGFEVTDASKRVASLSRPLWCRLWGMEPKPADFAKKQGPRLFDQLQEQHQSVGQTRTSCYSRSVQGNMIAFLLFGCIDYSFSESETPIERRSPRTRAEDPTPVAEAPVYACNRLGFPL